MAARDCRYHNHIIHVDDPMMVVVELLAVCSVVGDVRLAAVIISHDGGVGGARVDVVVVWCHCHAVLL